MKSASTKNGSKKAASATQARKLHGRIAFKINSKRQLALSPIHIPPESFICPMFLVPKKDGFLRPIIDFWELNKFVRWEPFKMEGIHLVKDLLQKGD